MIDIEEPLIEERWRTIADFPDYEISTHGHIYNMRRRQEMQTSTTTFGHRKITLRDYKGNRHTRSVAMLVAKAFIEPPNLLCDNVLLLDGNPENVRADNLVWRPRWFVWKYSNQFKGMIPTHYLNLSVRNIITDQEYKNTYEAAMAEGLLFIDIWKSTYLGSKVFPTMSVFEVIERV